MAKMIVSVEEYEGGNLLEDLAGHNVSVTILDTETGKAQTGHGLDSEDAAEHALWRHESKW